MAKRSSAYWQKKNDNDLYIDGYKYFIRFTHQFLLSLFDFAIVFGEDHFEFFPLF